MNDTSNDFNRTGNGPIANSTPKIESSKSDYPANYEEKPVVRLSSPYFTQYFV